MTPMRSLDSLPRVRQPRSVSFTPGKWLQQAVRLVPLLAVLTIFAFLSRGRFRSFEAFGCPCA